ncbi:fasciclin domain-containing protein [Trifolium pratense]|uniref:Fasciclin domain-containing protein n=2 Tax=Trifolium pratense TaxID=57577 RepID=A0A2K3M943_TRIPR|nr:uncharacterized protein LOC123920964 [Trifolium pratense]XP_045833159.1 uncharacterized protein LOC123924343 [Trifolium pratense]PNX87314.1 fasciclin domain-containing protein [Trifolium pratense]CAJ2653329.1 unnamed protein product [Trifolium pratense]
MKKHLILKHSIALVTILVTVCCIFIITVTFFKLPEAQNKTNQKMGFDPITRSRKISYQDFNLGKFGEMMIEMLPQDLAFTVFVPSEEAFKRDLHLNVNDSLKQDKFNDTYAIVSRVLGFSAVPRTLCSVDLRFGEVLSYDSLSGFPLYVSKDVDGMFVVNRIRSEIIDVRKNEIVVHVLDGVIMDADFEQSVSYED